MILPTNMTEQEVVDTIDNVVNRLARRFKFGYHDLDDMKQQGRLLALKALPKYDNKRPLENFLWTHVRNRLYNYKRDHYERLQLPCFQCDHHDVNDSSCNKYEDILECEIYNSWYIKNNSKKNIMSPIEFGQVKSENENNMSIDNDPHDNLECKELTELIEQNIPLCLRSDYIRMKDGIKIPKCRRDKVKGAITEILVEYGYWNI